MTETFGIDIGGANLKLSHYSGESHSVVFPMWTDFHRLGEAIAGLLERFSHPWQANSQLAITMTGEMADCFESRSMGVRHILQQVTQIIPDQRCWIYSVGGDWLSVVEAQEFPWSVAASNWHALATWILDEHAGIASQCHVLMDIGSTTVDIIPVKDGQIATDAKTDRDRLQLGQLVYSGFERTPIHSILHEVTLHERICPLIAERFATAIDLHLVLGSALEEAENTDTADGRPRTRRSAQVRLARMIGEDLERVDEQLVTEIARQAVIAQAQQIAAALSRNLPMAGTSTPQQPDWIGSIGRVLVTGHGESLIDYIRALPEMRQVVFSRLLKDQASRCAPALAVARLLAKGLA